MVDFSAMEVKTHQERSSDEPIAPTAIENMIIHKSVKEHKNAKENTLTSGKEDSMINTIVIVEDTAQILSQNAEGAKSQ